MSEDSILISKKNKVLIIPPLIEKFLKESVDLRVYIIVDAHTYRIEINGILKQGDSYYYIINDTVRFRFSVLSVNKIVWDQKWVINIQDPSCY